jgi:hypothetical protein
VVEGGRLSPEEEMDLKGRESNRKRWSNMQWQGKAFVVISASSKHNRELLLESKSCETRTWQRHNDRIS